MPVDRRAEDPPKTDRTDLEVWMRVKGPELLRENAANIALAVAVLIAAGFFFYNRQQAKRVESQAVQQNAAAAYDYSTQLQRALAGPSNSDASARDRQQRARDAINAADVVINADAATPAQRAIALLAKGDVYWALANAPAVALATSQPVASFTVKPADGFLADAETAYSEILRSYGDEAEPVASALLSLAAINENRGKFDDAAKWYQHAIDEPSLRPAYHDIAAARLAMLADLRKPYTLATSATQPTEPMIFRDRDARTTAPATLPTGAVVPNATTLPADATTRPAPVVLPETEPAATQP